MRNGSEERLRKSVFAWEMAQQRPGKRDLRCKRRSCSSGDGVLRTWHSPTLRLVWNWRPGSGVTLEKGASKIWSNSLRTWWSEQDSKSRRHMLHHQRVRGCCCFRTTAHDRYTFSTTRIGVHVLEFLVSIPGGHCYRRPICHAICIYYFLGSTGMQRCQLPVDTWVTVLEFFKSTISTPKKYWPLGR
jgi:hypothetical protein